MLTRISDLDPRQVPALTTTSEAGDEFAVYAAWPHQLRFHEAEAPNVLALGTRGTGKSLMIRMDAIIRCLIFHNFHALILRRTMPELRESHLKFIQAEVEAVGGVFLTTTSTAKFPNGSTLVFRHCETEADILNFLSSEYGFIGFDELSTFTLEQFLKISAAARAPVGIGYQAVVRAGSNPLGPGAEWMYDWFVDHIVDLEEYPDYNPADFEMQFSTLDDNPSLDAQEYKGRLRNLPEHVRRAWLLGERVSEGMYFSDFHKTDEDGLPWHVIGSMPTYRSRDEEVPILDLSWIKIYRAIDWGYSPDPAVCLWIAVLPNGRAIVFKEKTWKRTLAPDVARDICQESKGMRIVESFCDPTMLIKEGQVYSLGELFELNGVPVTPSENDRILAGYAVHEHLNTIIDGKPKVQILSHCASLVKTFPQLRTDKADARKIADGPDHWVIALSYFCRGAASASREPGTSSVPRWMQPKRSRILRPR